METTIDDLPWTSEDIKSLRDFLSTQTGSRFLSKLAETVPPLFKKGDTNEVLIRNGEVSGSQDILKNIILLSRPLPTVQNQETSYPELTDDSKWQDGEKIQTT